MATPEGSPAETRTKKASFEEIVGDEDMPEFWKVNTKASGPIGRLPFTPEMLVQEPSGTIFGLSQDAGMGWEPSDLLRKRFLILSTAGGVRDADGKPIALGFHTGHFELSSLVEAASNQIREMHGIPFAGFCTDPCDGRSQGTAAMLDSLPYRNDAAQVLRRLARSLPTAGGVLGIATCDKGMPAMMMALAGLPNLASVIVPGGVTPMPKQGEDAGRIQSLGARFAHGEVTLEFAQDVGCRACASPGGGCQFYGTAGTSQAMAEALGLSLPHAALAPSGQPIWEGAAHRSAKALLLLEQEDITSSKILTASAFENALVVHAATGGSTNLLLHLPAIAFAAGQERMSVEDWRRVNASVPRLVDVLPNGPIGHSTSQFFAAGGIAEVMLHLRAMGLLDTSALTVTGRTVEENLNWWEHSKRRHTVRKHLSDFDQVDPDDVIMNADKARARGLTSTVTFPVGNIAPEGSVIKSTSIDPSVVEKDGIYQHTGSARVFRSEASAIAAIKSRGNDRIKKGEVIILTCAGPMGSGMEEVFQITAALKYLSYGKHIALLTDARFSGVSTGACVGHIGPEALEGGPIGKLRDGDLVSIEIDTINMEGSIDMVGTDGKEHGPHWGFAELSRRPVPDDLRPHPMLPDDTRLWAALQRVSGGAWGGCVFDTDEIIATLEAGMKARRLSAKVPI